MFKRLIGCCIVLFNFLFVFSQNIHESTVKDVDGNTYRTQNFGGFDWMVEDLKVSRFRNGQKIPFSNSLKSWEQHNRCIARKTGELNDEVLYNWYVVNDVRKVCPTGWKVPSEEDWNQLNHVLEAQRVKDTTKGDNSFLPRYNGNFDVLSSPSLIGKSSFWWSTNENSELSAWGREMTKDNFQLIKGHADKRDGLSVRCIKEKNK